MNNTIDTVEDLEDELFEHYRFDVPKGQLLLRIDKYLMNMIPNATRNKIQNAASCGDIYVNDIPVKSNYKVKPLDVIRIMLSHPPFENRVDPEDIPLDIVYEDDALLLINKPPDFVVHPGHGNYTGTLVNALAFHFDNLPMNSSERPGLVHRIDKDTSGLLVIAKTEAAMTHLAKQFEDYGVAAINFTDIHRDGMQTGPNIEETRQLAEAVCIPIVASGGVSTLDDVRNLLPLSMSGVIGVITGKALYSGTLNLKEAIELAKS